jgi:hypothetical protein
VIELTLPCGLFAYVQYCSDGPHAPAVRVLPGRFEGRLLKPAVTELVTQEHRFIVQQSLVALLRPRTGLGRIVAHAEVPAAAAAPPVFRIMGLPRTAKNPQGWSFVGATFPHLTGSEFSERFPEVDQTKLATTAIPFPARLAMLVDHEWQPSADRNGSWGIPRPPRYKT